jgi:ATP-dependent protease HslVU (ClpYQ) peptidase subunit
MNTDDKLKTLIAMNEANRQIFDLLDKFENALRAKDEQLGRRVRELAELREQLSYYTDKNQNQ